MNKIFASISLFIALAEAMYWIAPAPESSPDPRFNFDDIVYEENGSGQNNLERSQADAFMSLHLPQEEVVFYLLEKPQPMMTPEQKVQIGELYANGF